jgi:CHASE2 domain-containing sensor protein
MANYLPDALWMYGITAFFCIWHHKHPKERLYWTSVALLLGISYEVAQYKHWVAGTADLLDILAYSLGWIIAIRGYYE